MEGTIGNSKPHGAEVELDDQAPTQGSSDGDSSAFSVCILLYGRHLKLARRCLESIYQGLNEGREFIKDFRLGLNAVHWETDVYASYWAHRVYKNFQIPSILFRPERNAYKYPLMRRMFHDREHPAAEHLMWFDDDSYLDRIEGWWPQVHQLALNSDVVGFTNWLMPLRGERWKWIRLQPWYKPEAGPPPIHAKFGNKRCITFTQGAWWVIRRSIVRRFDWPLPELRHCGGDSIFGEICRQHQLRTTSFTAGVHINADQDGSNCKSERRGLNEDDLGTAYNDQQFPDLSHQDFYVHKVVVGDLPARKAT